MAKKKKTTTKKKSTTSKKKSTTSKKKSTTTIKKKSARKKAAGSRTRSENATGKQLVIVESPAKAKTINKYLGPEYVVRASVGHVATSPREHPRV